MTTIEPAKVCIKCRIMLPQTAEYFRHYISKGKNYVSRSCWDCFRSHKREVDRAWNEKNKDRIAQYKSSKYQERCQEAKRKYLELHESVPLCACGCGEEVTFNQSGPNRFYPWHIHRSPEIREAMSVGVKKRKAANRVPIERVRALLFDYKRKHNLTYSQLGERAGLSGGHIKSLMADNRPQVQGVTKEWMSNLMDRLAGKGSTPTTHQTKMMNRMTGSISVHTGGLYGLMVVRNEADRYLQACLEWNLQFLDDVFIVDDGSDDETLELCLNYTDNVIRRPDSIPSFIEHESKNRQYGWLSMSKMFELTDRDWVVAIDADEFLVTNNSNGDVRAAIDGLRLELTNTDRWCAKIHRPEVFDQKDEGLLVRTDLYWPKDYQYRLARFQSENLRFTDKQMGGGSLPLWYKSEISTRTAAAGPEVELLHVGYMTQEDREDKYARYVDHGNNGHNRKHINSILTRPRLERWSGQTPKIWRGLA